MENKDYKWMNSRVKLDFINRMPSGSKELILKIEEADRNRDVVGYCNAQDTLDIVGKKAYEAGSITKQQWDMLIERYPYPF